MNNDKIITTILHYFEKKLAILELLSSIILGDLCSPCLVGRRPSHGDIIIPFSNLEGTFVRDVASNFGFNRNI